MALPAPNLDDLRFQRDLVDEARKRITQYCPEWTEYNLSDPGITLIELFAWMTEMIVYRLNKVPEKNYIKFLELLGLARSPASSAKTDLTFWLSVSLPMSPESDQTVTVPAGLQVRSDSTTDEILFSTDRELLIVPPILAQLRKETEVNKNFYERLGIEIFYPFDRTRPKPGDTFYLGFDPQNDIRGHILQLQFECEPTEAVGIRREDPPWVWECSTGGQTWQELTLSQQQGEKDTTGGLNNESGSLVVYLPLEARPREMHGRTAFWLRCRIEQRYPSQGMYTESPRVTSIRAFSIGASVPATHAVVVENEALGVSRGEAGQEFQLEYAPILELGDGETLQVEEVRSGELVLAPWTFVPDFSHSGPHDRHFSLDAASGRVLLGPSVRQSDGSMRQYGRIPESGRNLVFKRYRYGGGVRGNLPVNSIRTLTSSLAYIARVTNLQRSHGGRDAETLEEVKLRAQRELQAQKRAVTIQDYEQFVMDYSRSIGKVRCLNPGREDRQENAGQVEILVVPSVGDALRASDLSRLWLSQQAAQDIVAHLDRFRLLTTSVQVRSPGYTGVRVKASVVADEYSDPTAVAQRVDQHLRNFLNPLMAFPEVEARDQLLENGWNGWPFGKDLFAAEIFALIQRVPGVRYVLDAALETRTVERDTAAINEETSALLAPLAERVLWIPHDSLVLSLDHEINMVPLSQVLESNRRQA